MITSDDCVKLSTRSTQKNCIGGKRSVHVDVVNPPRSFNGRHYLRSFFNSEQSTFRSVRIQRRNRKPRAFNAPTLKLTMRETDDLHYSITFDHPDRFRKRNMRR
jgi:hypothetical protein